MGIFIPGSILFLQREVEKAKHQCRLLGARAEDFLLVEILRSAKGLPVFIMGDRCVVRLLHDGKVYGFRTVIERTLTEPFPLVVFHYPSDLESKNLREGARLRSNIPVRVEPLGPPENEDTEGKADENEATEGEGAESQPAERPKLNQPHVATMIDISESGLQIAIPVLGPEAPEDDGPDIPAGINNENRSDYLSEKLERTYIAGDGVAVNLSLPAPVQADYDNVRADVCWARINGLYLFVGLRFVEPADGLTEGIRNLIEHQETYFHSEIISPLPR